MARYVSTKTASGGSAGGGSGVSLSEVCTAVCCVIGNNAQNTTTGIQVSPTTNQLIPGYSCWQMICNCQCWDDCYGCNVVWCVDTAKYRAFRLAYTGLRHCACCYMYFCIGLGDDNCFCQCSQAYRGVCVCMWPEKSCCCWTAYNCCQIVMEPCIYCCNSQWDNIWSFVYTVCAPQYKGCTSGNQGMGIHYDWCYSRKFVRYCDCYNRTGWDRSKGATHCHCLFWSCKQNSSKYLTRLCMKSSETPFQSALAGGNYPGNEGGDHSAGTPCWTIWAIPCHIPTFGTCNMSAS